MLTAEDALRPDAPLVNEFCASNIAYTSDFRFGDPEAGFKEADYIKEEKFSSQRVAVGFIEPHACLAEVDATGRVLLQAPNRALIRRGATCAGPLTCLSRRCAL